MINAGLRLCFWLPVVALLGIGLVMVTSTTTGMGMAPAQGVTGVEVNYGFIIRQVAALLVGLLGVVAIGLVGVDWLRRRWAIALIALGVVLLLAATPFIGVSVNGATRWISLGPIRIQPAELAKLGFIIVLAWYLCGVQERVRVNWHGVLVPILVFAVLAFLVYRTKDLGSVIVLGGILWLQLFYSGANWIYSTLLATLAMPMALYVTVFRTAYRFDRILAFLDPMNTDIAATYHLRQSFIAIATGGTWGVGLGQGPSKNAFLPERHTDFIYAVICEELGLVGGLVVAGLYLWLVIMGFVIAARSDDRFRRLLAVGLTGLIGIQAFWNMLVVVGALPTKGLTLPFISYGGSSMVVCLLAIGVLDVLARHCPQAQPVRSGQTSRIGAAVRKRRTNRQTEGVL